MIIASEPTIDLPLESLSLRQRLDLFHHLREELGFELNCEPQDWHFDILKEREERIKSGKDTLMGLDDFIAEMRKTMP
jgi:hypothetical protein